MRNIEIKARLNDPTGFQARLQQSAAKFTGTLQQRDVFFAIPQGRLKLRFVDHAAELIFYERSDDAAVRGSDYQRCAVADAEALCRILTAALGCCGEVCKKRQLYLLDNIRIHVDTVDGLGAYMEIEAVIDAQHSESVCEQAVQELLQVLGIQPAHYEAKAYIDLLQTKKI